MWLKGHTVKDTVQYAKHTLCIWVAHFWERILFHNETLWSKLLHTREERLVKASRGPLCWDCSVAQILSPPPQTQAYLSNTHRQQMTNEGPFCRRTPICWFCYQAGVFCFLQTATSSYSFKQATYKTSKTFQIPRLPLPVPKTAHLPTLPTRVSNLLMACT